MERILVQNLDSKAITGLSEENGVIAFYRGNSLLFSTETINLKHTTTGLLVRREIDNTVNELWIAADSVEIIPTSNGIDALIKQKQLLAAAQTESYININLWKDYVYLALNPAEFPFVKISEFTQEEWFYIGPFRNRFLLVDLMDLMSKLLKLPYCEAQSGPCEKYDNGRCRGWCVLIKSETAKTDAENPEQQHLQKLDALLKEAYVHVDNGLLEMIQNEKQKYESELEFTKAELLKPELDLLRRYRDWLIFLYKIKTLNYVTDKVSVKNGQLVAYKADGKEHDCPYAKVSYRANEVLALNKNMLDEARILFLERV